MVLGEGSALAEVVAVPFQNFQLLQLVALDGMALETLELFRIGVDPEVYFASLHDTGLPFCIPYLSTLF